MELQPAETHPRAGRRIQSLPGGQTLANSVKVQLTKFPFHLFLGVGYDKVAHPVQVLPRPVAKIKHMVIDITLSVRVACLACPRH